MSNAATGKPEHSYRRFARFVRRARRRAWTILLARYWLRAAAICVVLGAAVHVNSGVGLPVLIEVGAIVSLVVALVVSLVKRRMVADFMFTVDRHYDAAGRIVAAAEFLRTRESPDAFRKLAIEDAAEWISKHPRRGLPWTLGRAGRPAVGAALCLAAALLAGCESPQPTPRRKPAADPDVARPERGQRAEPGSTGSAMIGGDERQLDRGEDGQAPGRSDAGTSPGQTGSDAGTGPGQTGSGAVGTQQSGAETQPAPARTNDAEPRPAQTPPDIPPPKPADEAAPECDDTEPEPKQPGSRQPGTKEAEKKQDDREVDAPEDDVQAREADDQSPGVGPETEGVGEELVEGADPPPATPPVAPEDYRDARRQDLTRERVSPARRALIEQYFQNLSKSARRPASQPTSQPASQPASRPARKAEHS